MTIVQLGDEILRSISEPVDLSIEKEYINHLIEEMIKTVKEKDGAGLAAPQVGIAKRVIIIRNIETDQFFEMINPKIMWTSFDRECKKEGCLSILDESGNPIHKAIWRYKRIRVKWQDKEGNSHEELFKHPLQSRIIQHEIDHLQGRLFVDYLQNS